MEYDFDTVVNRIGIGNLMEESKPRAIREAGLPSYWGAEFNFKTAPAVIDAIRNAADNGLFGFTLLNPVYLERVLWWFEIQRNCVIRPEWILPTHGVIFSIATSLRAFTEKNDGMIMLTPGYGRYKQAADRLGRKTVESRLLLREGRYFIDFDDLENSMSRKENRLLVICNPNNPTGTVWNTQELEKIAELARRYDVIVFSDEIFAEVSFGGIRVVPYNQIAGEESGSITCTSLGKSFGLTGVNHSNVIIPDAALRESFLRQRNADHYGSIDPMLHAALLGAYTEEGAKWISAMREYVWKNYLFIDSFLKRNLPRVTVIEPQGTYMLWIDFAGLGLEEEELGGFLLDEALLCLDSGEEYGGPRTCMRMNISVPRHQLERSMELLGRAAKARGFGP